MDRLHWQRGDRPQHFVATMPEGGAEIWHQGTGPHGVAGWRGKLISGEAIETFTANDKQHAADQANEFWPNVVRPSGEDRSCSCA